MSNAKSTLWRLAAGAALGLTALGAQAQDKQLTLCWAAWDPANALVELSKDFTAKTGIQMKYEFVPWPNFAQRMLNELNSKGKLCDLLIGDSQWIGSAATEGHYVKLNDFFDKNGIKMSDFMPATVEGYSTWPKGTQELLGAAGHGRRRGLHLPQGLVRPARAAVPSSSRSTTATSPRPRPGTSSSRSPSSSRTARSTARRSTARRCTPSAAPRASPWA